MSQLALDGQLALVHPAFAAREALRHFADQSMLAEIKRDGHRTRAKSIVFGRRERPYNLFLCLACPETVVARWSSATNPAPKWAEERKRYHRAKHTDAWLAERRYVVPGEDREIDLVLGDALVEAFGRLTEVR